MPLLVLCALAACESVVEPEPTTELTVAGPALALGALHSCGIAENGRAWCWGDNRFGALGAPSRELCPGLVPCSTAPLLVSGGHRFHALAAGDAHTCGIADDGLYCWGHGSSGQLGAGDLRNRATPTRVAGEQRFVRVVAGSAHTCALTPEGAVWCWGSNGLGQLGVSASEVAEHRPHPGPVLPQLRFTTIGAGQHHTCAITHEGTVHCWGSNIAGQLGGGGAGPNAPPQQVLLPTARPSFRQVSGGWGHTCALASDQTTWCWGWNTHGELGAGVPLNARSVAIQLQDLPRFTALHARASMSCGLTAAGEGVCWPDRLGIPPVAPSGPGTVRYAGPFSSLRLGGHHACAVGTDGRAWCWGNNAFGQLGTDSHVSTTAPVTVVGGLRFLRQ